MYEIDIANKIVNFLGKYDRKSKITPSYIIFYSVYSPVSIIIHRNKYLIKFINSDLPYIKTEYDSNKIYSLVLSYIDLKEDFYNVGEEDFKENIKITKRNLIIDGIIK